MDNPNHDKATVSRISEWLIVNEYKTPTYIFIKEHIHVQALDEADTRPSAGKEDSKQEIGEESSKEEEETAKTSTLEKDLFGDDSDSSDMEDDTPTTATTTSSNKTEKGDLFGSSSSDDNEDLLDSKNNKKGRDGGGGDYDDDLGLGSDSDNDFGDVESVLSGGNYKKAAAKAIDIDTPLYEPIVGSENQVPILVRAPFHATFVPKPYTRESCFIPETQVKDSITGKSIHKYNYQHGVRCRLDNNSNKLESNTRLVKWSDGTESLVIGDEVFDVIANQPPKDLEQIYEVNSNNMHCRSIIEAKYSFRLESTNSALHKRFEESLSSKSKKRSNLKTVPIYVDLDKRRLEEMKRDEERNRHRKRLQANQRRMILKDNSLGVDFLEQGLVPDSDDDSDSNILNLKKRFKRGENIDKDKLLDDDSDSEDLLSKAKKSTNDDSDSFRFSASD